MRGDQQPSFREQGQPPFRDRDGNRDGNRDDGRDDNRGNRDPRFAAERPREGYQDRPRPESRPDGRGDARPPREREDRGNRDRGVDLVQHRIEVGHRDGVTPREIVGAIANESGLEGRYIGHIDIQDDHAIVGLPAGMPREVFQHLKRVFVCGKELQISVMEGAPPPRRPAAPGRRPAPAARRLTRRSTAPLPGGRPRSPRPPPGPRRLPQEAAGLK
nr:DbpA RNA binding domain-containing protein [uncultured Thiodictyon sp.]